MQDALWGLTTYFNPERYESRLHNYHAFRRRSRAQGLPLVTVELRTGDLGAELVADRDAEVLVQRTSTAVLWHKERLLNIALDSLPRECRYVCWLDADVLFEDDDWVQRSIRALTRHSVIQPFENVVKPPRGAEPTEPRHTRLGWWARRVIFTKRYAVSFCSRYRPGRPRFAGTTGYAWCARRAVLDRHRFYDRCILGGADRELALAFVLPTCEVPERELRIRHHRLRDHIARWHDEVYGDVRGDVSFLPGTILHLWHGDPRNRGYIDRHSILERHDFDPERHIVIDAGGCWCWGEGTDALAADVRTYFASRREDG
jgi:hypothetical protein